MGGYKGHVEDWREEVEMDEIQLDRWIGCDRERINKLEKD